VRVASLAEHSHQRLPILAGHTSWQALKTIGHERAAVETVRFMGCRIPVHGFFPTNRIVAQQATAPAISRRKGLAPMPAGR